MAKRKSVFIDREKIPLFINEIGKNIWGNFIASDLEKKGNQNRCIINADGQNAILDFYFNADGTTTVCATGSNMEISTQLKVILEERHTYSTKCEGQTYSFKNIPGEWAERLIEYLKELTNNNFSQKSIENPKHEMYKFNSTMGDLLCINLYETGTLTLQGKPAYLCSEAISLLSYCKEISIDDIVNTVNCLHSVDIKPDDVRSEMERLLPKSYHGIDDMILKLLSPSISLRKIKMPIEDYSCYAFPALRALEGYIKFLFDTKGNVSVGYTFYQIFNGNKLVSNIAVLFNVNCQHELERLYGYLKNNRHVIFHTEQILIGTTILESKTEADEIVNEVLNLIETSYININP